MEASLCSAIKANKQPCRQKAAYCCSNGHVVCAQHTMRLGGSSKRRQTDRKCAICMNLGVSSKVEWLFEPPIDADRRAGADPAERLA
jgi:hypothetical protein